MGILFWPKEKEHDNKRPWTECNESGDFQSTPSF